MQQMIPVSEITAESPGDDYVPMSNLVMSWVCANDAKGARKIEAADHFMVVTNGGEWGDGCLFLWRGWALRDHLSQRHDPGRTRVICYAKVQTVPAILEWARGEKAKA
jgi:hypothetical protein